MNVQKKFLMTALTVVSLMTFNAQASDVKEDVKIEVEAKNVVMSILGAKNKSTVALGVVKDSKIGGSVDISVKVGNVMSSVSGAGNKAELLIGAVM